MIKWHVYSNIPCLVQRSAVSVFPRLGRISEESVEFFERMNAILQKQQNMLQAAQAEVTTTPPSSSPSATHLKCVCVSLGTIIGATMAAGVTFVGRRTGWSWNSGSSAAMSSRSALPA